jgi:hypothetical protein
VDDLETILTEERIPDGWESRIRNRKGLTMSRFNVTAMRVEIATTKGGKSLGDSADVEKSE